MHFVVVVVVVVLFCFVSCFGLFVVVLRFHPGNLKQTNCSTICIRCLCMHVVFCICV